MAYKVAMAVDMSNFPKQAGHQQGEEQNQALPPATHIKTYQPEYFDKNKLAVMYSFVLQSSFSLHIKCFVRWRLTDKTSHGRKKKIDSVFDISSDAWNLFTCIPRSNICLRSRPVALGVIR